MSIEHKAQEIKELERMKEELEAEITALQDEIKKQLTEANTDSMTAGAFKITWKAITSSRLDTSALKAALPEIAQRFTKTTTARRFLIA